MLYILTLLTFVATSLNYIFTIPTHISTFILIFFICSYFFLKKKRILYFIFFMFLITLFSVTTFKLDFQKQKIYNFKIKKDGKNISVLKVNNRYFKKKLYLNTDDFSKKNGFFILKARVLKIVENENYISINIEIINTKNTYLNKTRNYIREKLYEISYKYNKSLYGFLEAAIMGEKSEIDKDISDNFRNAGIAHILVISGLHIAFFILIILTIVEKLNVNYHMKYIITFIILTLYCFCVGMGASVMRAYIMGGIWIISKLLFEESDLKKSTAIAFIISHIVDPFAIFSLSFQLSYIAVLAIIFIYPAIKKENFIYNIFALSLSVQIALVPISLYYFNKIPILTFISNLIITPLASFLIQLSLVSILISIIIPFLSETLGFILNIIWEIVVFYANVFSKIPLMNITIYKNINFIVPIFFYLLLIIVFYGEKIKKEYKMFLGFVFLILSYMDFSTCPDFLKIDENYFKKTNLGKGILVLNEKLEKDDYIKFVKRGVEIDEIDVIVGDEVLYKKCSFFKKKKKVNRLGAKDLVKIDDVYLYVKNGFFILKEKVETTDK